jgi:glycosyltransferase involved in cell wall biosynthesis
MKIIKQVFSLLVLFFSKFASFFVSKKLPRKLYFVMDESSSGWILDSTSKEVSKRLGQIPSALFYGLKQIPKAEYYFFMHFFYFKKALLSNPHVWKAKNIVYFTHPRADLGISDRELVYLLQLAHGVVVLNSEYKRLLVSLGISSEKIQVIHFGVDPTMFLPHERNTQKIGFSMALYERKNPAKVVELVEGLPQYSFFLFGKGWKDTPYFDRLSRCKNFEYEEPTYQELPGCYQRIDILISPSRLEGGPTPVLESLVSNVLPIATTLGFAPDLITHGSNGYLFHPDDSVEKIGGLIQQAFQNKNEVSASGSIGSWDECVRRFSVFFEGEKKK